MTSILANAKYLTIRAFRFLNDYRFALVLGELGALGIAVYGLLHPDAKLAIWVAVVVASSLLVHAALEVWNLRRSRKPIRYFYTRDFLMKAFDEAVGRGVLFFSHSDGRILIIPPPPVFCRHNSTHEDSINSFERSEWRSLQYCIQNFGGPLALQSTKRGQLIVTAGHPESIGYLWRWNPNTCLAEVYEHRANSIVLPGFYVSDIDSPRWAYYPMAGTSNTGDMFVSFLRLTRYDVSAAAQMLSSIDGAGGGGDESGSE